MTFLITLFCLVTFVIGIYFKNYIISIMRIILKKLPFRSPACANPDNSFRFKPVNTAIAVMMMLSEVAEYYHWADLSLFSKRIKWFFDFMALFI